MVSTVGWLELAVIDPVGEQVDGGSAEGTEDEKTGGGGAEFADDAKNIFHRRAPLCNVIFIFSIRRF